MSDRPKIILCSHARYPEVVERDAYVFSSARLPEGFLLETTIESAAALSEDLARWLSSLDAGAYP